MIIWIKRAAWIIGLLTFFAVVAISIDPSDPFNMTNLIIALIKGTVAAALLWIIGFVLADVALKGVLEDVDPEKVDVLEGGLIQRITDEKLRVTPGSTEKFRGSEAARIIEKKLRMEMEKRIKDEENE